MTGRASVFTGPEREGATQVLRGEDVGAQSDGAVSAQDPTPAPRPAAPARDREAESDHAAADGRCSPDPCRNTDRYRLVTPFSLRI